MKTLFENNGADFSACGKYRYKLWRIWDDRLPIAMCIGLNPSTANSDTNDPTIGILKRMLTKLGYGGFYMTNLFTIISSDPKILRSQTEWGDWLKDKEVLINTAKECQDIIFAWGVFKEAQGRAYECARHFTKGKCFGLAKSGAPLHPLALMYNGTQKNPCLINFNQLPHQAVEK